MSSIEERICTWGSGRAKEVLAFLRRGVAAEAAPELGEDELALLMALYTSRAACFARDVVRWMRPEAMLAGVESYFRGRLPDGASGKLRRQAYELVRPALARAADEGQAAYPAVLALTPLGASGAAGVMRALSARGTVEGEGARLIVARAVARMFDGGAAPCPHCGGDSDPVDVSGDEEFSCRCRYCGRCFKALSPLDGVSFGTHATVPRGDVVRYILDGVRPGGGKGALVMCDRVKMGISCSLREVIVRERAREGEGPLARAVSPDCALEMLDLVHLGAHELRRSKGGCALRFDWLPRPSAAVVEEVKSYVGACARLRGGADGAYARAYACAMLGVFEKGAAPLRRGTPFQRKMARLAVQCLIPAIEAAAGLGSDTRGAMRAVAVPCGLPVNLYEGLAAVKVKGEVKAEAKVKPKGEAKPKGDAEVNAEANAEANAEVNAEAEAEAEAKPKGDANAEPKGEANAEAAPGPAVKADARTVVPAAPPLTPAACGERPVLTRVAHAAPSPVDPRLAASVLLGEAPPPVDGCDPAGAAAAVARLASLVEVYDAICGTESARAFKCYALLRMAGYPDGLCKDAARVCDAALDGWRRVLAPVVSGNSNGKEAAL